MTGGAREAPGKARGRERRAAGGRGLGRNGPVTAIAALMLAAGLVALYWSDIAGFASQVGFDRQIASVERVRDEIGREGGPPRDGEDAAEWCEHLLAEGRLSEEAAPYAAALPRFEAYNESLRAAGGQRLDDPFATGGVQEPLAESGVEDDLVGAVSVSSIGCNLPLYFGATAEKMARGAAVVAGTSLPLGQADSNCVIAAHRGYAQAAMFRDIEDIRAGDPVVVATPWDVLTYRAVAFKVIAPDDVASVLIQPGRDLVTLLTCHPYGSNVTRYLVICERDETGGAGMAGGGPLDGTAPGPGDGAAGDAAARGPGVLQAERLLKGVATLALVLAFALFAAKRTRRRARKGARRDAPQDG